MSTANEQLKALIQNDPEAKLAIAKARIRRDLLNEIYDIIEPVIDDDWDNIDASVSRFSVELSLLITAAHKKTLEGLKRVEIDHVSPDAILNTKEVLESKIFGASMATADFNARIDTELARLEPKSAEEKE